MFEFLFKYPGSVFTKGRLVFLSALPVWLLPVLIVFVCVSLTLLTYRRIPQVLTELRNWRLWSLAAMQAASLALILLLLWQPAMTVAALSSHQNIIAVVLDNSRSMTIADQDGRTREAAALDVLANNLLPGLQKRFQTRLYYLGKDIKQVDRFTNTQPVDTATNINSGLRHLAEDTTDLPIGAVLLLSDGGQNSVEMGSSGVALESLQALHNRRLPVHTIGFGRPELARDLEIENVSAATTAVVNSRLSATVSFVQYGYAGQAAKIRVRDGNNLLSSQEVKLAPDGVLQTESLFFSAGNAGARNLQFVIEPLVGEENIKNNQLTRPVLITDKQRRILYIEGEPRWEFKFIRRAEEDDPTIQLVSMLRTSENKVYRQGIKQPSELADGFPVRPEDLFGYSGIVIGSVDVNYFTPLQRELLREYVDRRGGGLLFLGGRMSLGNGGWETSSLNDLIPTFLPAARNTFHRNPATVELTAEGKDSPITRLVDDSSTNIERWKKLAYLADYQDAGSPKPAASVLVQMSVGRKKLPLLVTESYGHGRTALLATGGTWRWQMAETLGDPSHNLFWQQLLRWLVADTAGPVSASVSSHILSDEGGLRLSAQVHDAQFQPAANAHVTAHLLGPDGINALIDLQPSQDIPGLYTTEWSADKPGSYLTEIVAEDGSKQKQELGRDVLTFRREDGVAEDFHIQQNRQLLRQLSSQTGGRYWTPDAIKDLPQAISYSEGGVSVRTTNELWNMPIVFLFLIGLSATEWLLRRKWGMV